MYPVTPVAGAGRSLDSAFEKFMARDGGHHRWLGVISTRIITSLRRRKTGVHGGS